MEVPRTALPSSDSSMQTSARAGTQPNVTSDDSTAIATLNETPGQPPTAGDTDDTTIRTSMPRNEELEQMLQWQPGEFSDDDEEEDRRWRESWNNLNDTRYNMYNVWSDLTARSQELTAQLNELSANVQQTTMMLQTLRHNFASTNEVLGIAASDAVRQNISSDNSSDLVGQNISSDNPSDPVGQSAKGTAEPDTIEPPPRSAEQEAIMAQARALYQRDFGNDENAIIRAREETDERIQRLPPQLQAMVQWFTEELERCSTPEIAEAVVKIDHMRQAYRSTENRQSTPAIAETLTRTPELPHTLLRMTPKKPRMKAKRRSKQDNELVAAASKIHRREWGDVDIDQWMQDTEEERKNLPSNYQAAEARLAGVMDRCSTPEVAALIIEFDELKQHRPSTPEVVALMNSFSDKYQPATEREASRTTALLAKKPEVAPTPFHRTSAISTNTDAQPQHGTEDDKNLAIASKVFQKGFEELRSEAISICRRDIGLASHFQVTEEPVQDLSPEELEDKVKFDKEREQWTDKELAAAVVFIDQLRQSRKQPTPPPSTSQAENKDIVTPKYHELQKMRPRRYLHGLSRMEITTICSEVLTCLACDDDFLRDEWLTVLHILVEHGFPETFLRNVKDIYVLADYVVLRSTQHPRADFWFALRNARCDRIAAELIVLRGEVQQPHRQAVTFQLPQANGSNATHAQAPTRQQQQQPRTFHSSSQQSQQPQQQPPTLRQEQPDPSRSTNATTGQNATAPRQIRYVRLGSTPPDNANAPNLAPAATPATPRQQNNQQQVANGTSANATQPTAKTTQKKPPNQGIRARIIPPVHVQQLQQHMAQREHEQRQNQPRRSNAAEHGRYSHEAVERAHSEARTGRGQTPARKTEGRRTPSPDRRSGRGQTPTRQSNGRQRSPNTTDRRGSRGRTPARESVEREQPPAKKDGRENRGKTPAREGTGGEQTGPSKPAKRRAEDAPAASSKKPKSREFVDSSSDTSRSPSPHKQQAAMPEAANDPTVRKYTRKRAAPPARRPPHPPPLPPIDAQPGEEEDSNGKQPPGPSRQATPPEEYDPENPGGVFAEGPSTLEKDLELSDQGESESEDESAHENGSEQGNECEFEEE